MISLISIALGALAAQAAIVPRANPNCITVHKGVLSASLKGMVSSSIRPFHSNAHNSTLQATCTPSRPPPAASSPTLVTTTIPSLSSSRLACLRTPPWARVAETASTPDVSSFLPRSNAFQSPTKRPLTLPTTSPSANALKAAVRTSPSPLRPSSITPLRTIPSIG